MDDLVQWLRAQLDEDERIARRACEYADAAWRLDEDGETVLWWPPEPRVAEKEREKGLPVVSDRWRGQTIAPGGGRITPHIAEHDPARVLREIDAKQRLVELHTSDGGHECPAGRDFTGVYVDYEQDCLTLRLLALPYADREGYQESWRP